MRMEKKRSGLTLCLLFIFCGRGLESANLESGYQFPSIPIKVSTGKISTVSTFNSISVYFNSPNGKNSEEAIMRYRAKNSTLWSQAQSLWFDDRLAISFTPNKAEQAQQYRGSIVKLASNTEYELQVLMVPSGEMATTTAKTWNETYPVLKKIELSGIVKDTITLSESGSPTGYIVLTAKADSVSDVAGLKDYNLSITGSYIIVRGLTLKNAAQHGIFLGPNSHDIVIEDCDISGWGRIAPDEISQLNNFGMNLDSAISNGRNSAAINTRLVIQRNSLHHPRPTANNWDQNRQEYDENEKPRFISPGVPRMNPHPVGPQAICITYSAGNNVIRYNDIYSDDQHRFNDSMGGDGSNFTFEGFPGPDSDIYGNTISYCWDDGIESEGGNMNVRIFENYIDRVYKMIAISPVSVGPAYVFRNVVFRGTRVPDPKAASKGTAFIKSQAKADQKKPEFFYGKGRVYVYNNTLLTAVENEVDQGLDMGITRTATTLYNYVVRNNVLNALHIAIDDNQNMTGDPNNLNRNDYDRDLYQLGMNVNLAIQEKHGIVAAPEYDANSGSGPFALSAGSPGQDQGFVIPNFTDGFVGVAPDIGAQERGASPLKFGSHWSQAKVNQAPVANAGNDQTVTLPSAASLSGSATDDGLPTGNALSYSWIKISGAGTVTFASVTAAATTATFSTTGTYMLRLTASDSAMTSTDDVQVTVNPAPAVNQPPVVNAGAPITVTLPNTADLIGSASDDGLPVGSVLTYAWSRTSGTGIVTFANAAVAQTTASFSTAGTYVLNLKASDGALGGSGNVTVTVNPVPVVNQAPVVNVGFPITVTLPNTASLNGSASDDGLPTGSVLKCAWTKVSGAGTVTFAAPAAAQTTASFSTAGSYVLNLSVYDGALSGSGNVSVQVNPNPDGDGDGMLDTWEVAHSLNPLNAADAALDADNDGLSDLQEYQNGTDPQKADTDGDGLPDGWEVAHHLRPLTASATGDADSDGLSNLQEYQRGTDPEKADTDNDGLPDKFEVGHNLNPLADNSTVDTDHDGVSDVHEYKLGQDPTVAAPPMPPEARVIGAAKTGNTVELEAVSGHGGGVVITAVEWTLVSQPGGGTLVAGTKPGEMGLQIGQKGDYVLEATATDANGMKSSTVVHVQAYDAGNLPPVADAGPDAYGDVGKAVELYGLNSSDPEDGAQLTYRWKLLSRPGNSAADLSVADKAIGRFTPDQPGMYIFALSVLDSTGQASVSLDPSAPGAIELPGDATVYVEVRGSTDNPPRAQVAKEEVTAAAGTSVKLDATGSSDLDGSALSYAWEFVSRPVGSHTALSDVTAAAPAFTPDISGTYEIRLTVKDIEGHTDTRVMTVYAEGAGTHHPVAKAGAVQKLVAGTSDFSVHLDSSQTTDVDGDTLTYLWTQIEGPAVELDNPTLATPTFVIPASRPRRAGVYRFCLEVTDAFGFTNAATTAVLVNTAGEHVPELKAFSFPPLVGGGASHRIVLGKESRIAVQVDSSGDSGEKLRVFWTQIFGPAALFSFDSASPDDGVENEILVVQAKQAGSYTFKVYVDDGKPRGLEQELSFEADAAAVPVANSTANSATVVAESLSATATGDVNEIAGTLGAASKVQGAASAGGGCFFSF